MKKLIFSFIALTLIGGVILSLIAGSWIMLAATVLLMGSSFVISYVGSKIALADDGDAEDDTVVCYHHAYANK